MDLGAVLVCLIHRRSLPKVVYVNSTENGGIRLRIELARKMRQLLLCLVVNILDYVFVAYLFKED